MRCGAINYPLLLLLLYLDSDPSIQRNAVCFVWLQLTSLIINERIPLLFCCLFFAGFIRNLPIFRFVSMLHPDRKIWGPLFGFFARGMLIVTVWLAEAAGWLAARKPLWDGSFNVITYHPTPSVSVAPYGKPLWTRPSAGVGMYLSWLEHRTGTLLTQIRFPGAARVFPPRVNFQCRFSYGVRTTPCQLHAFTSVRTLKILLSMSEFGGFRKTL